MSNKKYWNSAKADWLCKPKNHVYLHTRTSQEIQELGGTFNTVATPWAFDGYGARAQGLVLSLQRLRRASDEHLRCCWIYCCRRSSWTWGDKREIRGGAPYWRSGTDCCCWRRTQWLGNDDCWAKGAGARRSSQGCSSKDCLFCSLVTGDLCSRSGWNPQRWQAAGTRSNRC